MSETTRHTGPLFRFVFALGALLSLLAGIQLYVLSERTEDYFAWTIAAPLSASFFGAFYWGAVVIATLSFPRREWVRARVGLFGLIVFFLLTLAATLIHLDKFHLDDGRSAARVSAWIWLVVYVVVPAFGTFALARQRRYRGLDPPLAAPMQGWYRVALAGTGAGLAVVGIVLFASPDAGADLWPWPLTPLTSRAASAWLLGLAVILGTMWHDRDHDRALPGAALCTVLPVLLAIALVRYAGDVEWGRGAAYVACLALVLVLGLVGVRRGRQARV